MNNPGALEMLKMTTHSGNWEVHLPFEVVHKKDGRIALLDNRNIKIFDHLFDGKDFSDENFHPFIPVVRHPDVKPLRWSHSEFAIVPDGKELEIIFFEAK